MPSDPNRLPYTRPPKSDESLRGYLLGLAIDNGYQSLARLLEFSHGPKSRPTSFDAYGLNPLSELTAQPVVSLQKLVYHKTASATREFQGQQIPDFLISPRRLKFCPTCIEELPELQTGFKAIWDLQLSVVCPKHGTYLISECSNCGKAPTWFPTPWFQCTCGNDIRMTPNQSADPEVLEISQLLMHPFVPNALTMTGRLPSALGKIEPGNLHWIVAITGCWANGIVEGQISKRLEELASTQRIDVLKKAYWVFSDWPSNFTAFLDQSRGLARQPRSSSLMNQEFGALFDALMYKIRDPNSEFIRGEMKSYGESLSDQDKVETLDNVSLVKLSQETGVGVSALRKMSVGGSIKIFKEKRGYKKDRYFISNCDIKKLHGKLADNITLQEVSQILGLGIKTIIRLRDEGVFKSDTEILRDGRSDTMFSKQDAEDFVNTVVGNAKRLGNLPAGQYQKISDAMRMYCINGLTRSDMFKSVIAGALPTYTKDISPKLGDIFIHRGEIKEYVLARINKKRDMISLEVASKEFGLSVDKVKNLAKNKTIVSSVVTHGARQYRLVSRKSIRAWARKLISKSKA